MKDFRAKKKNVKKEISNTLINIFKYKNTFIILNLNCLFFNFLYDKQRCPKYCIKIKLILLFHVVYITKILKACFKRIPRI